MAVKTKKENAISVNMPFSTEDYLNDTLQQSCWKNFQVRVGMSKASEADKKET